ncbi:MAG TPA: nitrilase family protein [Puia sp.]|nr:nitrilase family protein [Puia sp.]
MSTLSVTTIQTDLCWEDKLANLRQLGEKIDRIDDHTELVILPEMFSTGFSMRPAELAEPMDGRTVEWMRNVAARKKVILTGSIIVAENGRYFNRLIWMLPTGKCGHYDKRHRFAYGGEDDQYTAGNKRLVASVKGWKVLLLICYDLRFPVWSRQRVAAAGTAAAMAVNPVVNPASTSAAAGHAAPREGAASAPSLEYDLILYVANWPERRSLAWKTLLPARAVENQSFVIGVNRVGSDGNNIAYAGDSMVIDPLGETIYHAGRGEDVHTLTIEKEHLETIRSRFPFWRDADHFYIEP